MLWWAKDETPMVTWAPKNPWEWVKQAKLRASEVFHPGREASLEVQINRPFQKKK